jgi:hypothetical protein
MMVLPPRDRAALLMQIHRRESTPRELEERRPGVLRAMRFSERHYLHWCHVRKIEPDLPDVYDDPNEVVPPELAAWRFPGIAEARDEDKARLVREAPEGREALRDYLEHHGVRPQHFGRWRRKFADKIKEAA